MSAAMPSRPTLLRTTKTQSFTERVAANMRGRLAAELVTDRDLAEILNISRYRAARLWTGKIDYDLRQVIDISSALEWDFFKVMGELGTV